MVCLHSKKCSLNDGHNKSLQLTKIPATNFASQNIALGIFATELSVRLLVMVDIREKRKVTISTIKEIGNPQIFAQLGYDVLSEAPAMGFEGLDGQSVTTV